MTWSDPIVDEVRQARDAYAARFNYDLRAIYRDLKQKEKCSGRAIVSPPKDSPGGEPIAPLQRGGLGNDESSSIAPYPNDPLAELHR